MRDGAMSEFVGVRFTPERVSDLRRRADLADVSMSKFVRAAVASALEAQDFATTLAREVGRKAAPRGAPPPSPTAAA